MKFLISHSYLISFLNSSSLFSFFFFLFLFSLSGFVFFFFFFFSSQDLGILDPRSFSGKTKKLKTSELSFFENLDEVNMMFPRGDEWNGRSKKSRNQRNHEIGLKQAYIGSYIKGFWKNYRGFYAYRQPRIINMMMRK